MGCVYRFISPSNKSYIGKTISTFNERYKTHIYAFKAGNKTIFYDAVKKYGFENFKTEILAEADSDIELKDMEKYYISFYNSYGENGYNMTPGGDGNRLIGELNGMYGKHHTKEARDKMSLSRKGKQTGNKNPWHKSNRTDEELKTRSLKARKSFKENFEKLSTEEQQKIRQQKSDTSKKTWDNKSKEEQQKMTQGLRYWEYMSKEELDIINSKKCHIGMSHPRASFFFKITDPNGNEYLVEMLKGLKTFCGKHNLTYHTLVKSSKNKQVVEYSRFATNKTAKNTVGWSAVRMKRIKIRS